MGQLARHNLTARGFVALSVAAALAVPGTASAAPRSRREPGKITAGQFAPARPPAASYGPNPNEECLTSGVFDDVMRQLEGTAKSNSRKAPTMDGRLCAVAEAFLGWDPSHDGVPRPKVLTFTSQWFGVPATVGAPTIATFETEDTRVIAQKVAEAVTNEVMRASYPRVGLATQRLRKGTTKIAFVVLDAAVELDPLPRRLELGQTAKLSGKLLGGAAEPRVLVSDSVGKLSEPKQGGADAFAAEVACGDRKGRVQVELRAEGGTGKTGTLAVFPVLCAEDLPKSVALAPEPWPTDQAGAESKIFELLNAERAQGGLPPLERDPVVGKVARELAADIAARGGTPGGASIEERLKAEGIASQVILQSAAADRTYERAQDRLVASATNRSNIMTTEANKVGVGAVTQNDLEGHPVVIVTEVFVKELPPIDVAKVRQQLRDAVTQKRKDARTNALADDATLDATAQKYAEALAAGGGTLPKEKSQELTAPLNTGFRSVTMVSGAKPEPLDLAEEPQTTATGKVLGVGAAQGRHPVLGRNAVYAVIMVGTPRGATEPASATPAKKKKAAAPAKPKT